MVIMCIIGLTSSPTVRTDSTVSLQLNKNSVISCCQSRCKVLQCNFTVNMKCLTALFACGCRCSCHSNRWAWQLNPECFLLLSYVLLDANLLNSHATFQMKAERHLAYKFPSRTVTVSFVLPGSPGSKTYFAVSLLILQADSDIKTLPGAALKWPYYENPSLGSYNTKHIAEKDTAVCQLHGWITQTQANAPAVLNLSANLTSGTKWKWILCQLN